MCGLATEGWCITLRLSYRRKELGKRNYMNTGSYLSGGFRMQVDLCTWELWLVSSEGLVVCLVLMLVIQAGCVPPLALLCLVCLHLHPQVVAHSHESGACVCVCNYFHLPPLYNFEDQRHLCTHQDTIPCNLVIEF